MKNSIFLLMFALLPFVANAQSDSIAIPVYLLDSFEQGTVYFNNANPAESRFNYNLFTGKVEYKDNGMLYELADLENVIGLKIGNTVLLQTKPGVFYEKVALGNIDLYIHHIYKTPPKGKKGAMGVYFQSFAIMNMATIAMNGRTYVLASDIDYEVRENNSYYLSIANEYKQVNSANSLAKLFKSHSSEIKDFCKTEKINFNNLADVKKAVGFCGKYIE